MSILGIRDRRGLGLGWTASIALAISVAELMLSAEKVVKLSNFSRLAAGMVTVLPNKAGIEMSFTRSRRVWRFFFKT